MNDFSSELSTPERMISCYLLFLEIQSQTNLLSLSGKTLCVTAGPAPCLIAGSSTLLCQYINLQLLNTNPQGACLYCEHPQQVGCGVLGIKASLNIQSLSYVDFSGWHRSDLSPTLL